MLNKLWHDRQVSRARGERGASLVEFAILAPLLIVLVLGIVEFGWLFSQNNDVRHGPREVLLGSPL